MTDAYSDPFLLFSPYKSLTLQSRDRMGTKKAKPLWTEIMDLMGVEYGDIMKSFYATD